MIILKNILIPNFAIKMFLLKGHSEVQWNLHEWSLLSKSHLPITASFQDPRSAILLTSQQNALPNCVDPENDLIRFCFFCADTFMQGHDRVHEGLSFNLNLDSFEENTEPRTWSYTSWN